MDSWEIITLCVLFCMFEIFRNKKVFLKRLKELNGFWIGQFVYARFRRVVSIGWLASLEMGSIKNIEYKGWARTCYTLEGQCLRGHCWDLPAWDLLTWILEVSLSHEALWGFLPLFFLLWLCNKQMSFQLYFTNCRTEDTEECHPVS